jgi:hypothetical protein
LTLIAGRINEWFHYDCNLNKLQSQGVATVNEKAFKKVRFRLPLVGKNHK